LPTIISHKKIVQYIEQNSGGDGIAIQNIIQTFRDVEPRIDVIDKAIRYLIDEGHIYNTTGR
jgi:hypothetical protein